MLLVLVSNNVGAVLYKSMLDYFSQPFVEATYPKECIFQLDGAPDYTGLHTKEHFMMERMTVTTCLAWSPDTNVIENCWGTSSHVLYNGERQLDTLSDLREALIYE